MHQWACIIMSLYFPASGVARNCGIILQQRAKTRLLITERREGLHVIQSWVQSNTHQQCEGWRNKIWKPERAYDLEEQRVWCCDHVEENLVTGIIDCWCLQEKKNCCIEQFWLNVIYKKSSTTTIIMLLPISFLFQFFVVPETYVVWTMFFFSLFSSLVCVCILNSLCLCKDGI